MKKLVCLAAAVFALSMQVSGVGIDVNLGPLGGADVDVGPEGVQVGADALGVGGNAGVGPQGIHAGASAWVVGADVGIGNYTNADLVLFPGPNDTWTYGTSTAFNAYPQSTQEYFWTSLRRPHDRRIYVYKIDPVTKQLVEFEYVAQ